MLVLTSTAVSWRWSRLPNLGRMRPNVIRPKASVSVSALPQIRMRLLSHGMASKPATRGFNTVMTGFSHHIWTIQIFLRHINSPGAEERNLFLCDPPLLRFLFWWSTQLNRLGFAAHPLAISNCENHQCLDVGRILGRPTCSSVWHTSVRCLASSFPMSWTTSSTAL